MLIPLSSEPSSIDILVSQRGVSSIRCVRCFDLFLCRRPFNAHNQLALAMKINTGKVAPIPSRYSPGLFATIEWMLNKTVSSFFCWCCFCILPPEMVTGYGNYSAPCVVTMVDFVFVAPAWLHPLRIYMSAWVCLQRLRLITDRSRIETKTSARPSCGQNTKG